MRVIVVWLPCMSVSWVVRSLFSCSTTTTTTTQTRFCNEGVPEWVLDPATASTFPVPLAPAPWPVVNGTGMPPPTDCQSLSWFELYFSEAVAKEFGRLYTVSNQTAAQQREGGKPAEEGLFAEQFAQYWEKVAATFAGSASVIGYEIINEPFCGDVYARPELVLPGVADREVLQPFYEMIAGRYV
jgi:endoglycosylceramidase